MLRWTLLLIVTLSVILYFQHQIAINRVFLLLCRKFCTFVTVAHFFDVIIIYVGNNSNFAKMGKMGI